MADGPTTMNGPLHTDEASLSDRQITAYFASAPQAQAVQQALIAAGIPADRIAVCATSEAAAGLAPADQSIIGKIRETILPDDSQRATRDAVASGDTRLVVIPSAETVDQVVDIIQAGNPHHFDADLERWRNSPPA